MLATVCIHDPSLPPRHRRRFHILDTPLSTSRHVRPTYVYGSHIHNSIFDGNNSLWRPCADLAVPGYLSLGDFVCPFALPSLLVVFVIVCLLRSLSYLPVCPERFVLLKIGVLPRAGREQPGPRGLMAAATLHLISVSLPFKYPIDILYTYRYSNMSRPCELASPGV